MAVPPLVRILCADDEPLVLEMVQIALVDLGGYQLVRCPSGLEVVARAKEFDPDLILLDVHMPDLGGPATMEVLRAEPRFRTTPVIFMTATDAPGEIDDLRALGAIAVISKPFKFDGLADQLQAAWETHHG